MSSAPPGEQPVHSQHGELPLKRRRGGRRTSQPDMTVEERKRLRVLKNRESAMKSLAKKAEYAAKLEKLKEEAERQHDATYIRLRQTVSLAVELRSHLDELTPDESLSLIDVDRVIQRCSQLLDTPLEADRSRSGISDAYVPREALF